MPVFAKESILKTYAWEDSMEETIRTFIAIELSPEIRGWLGRAKSVLEGRITPGAVRWVNVDSIHLTLKFLGEVRARRLEAVRAVMEESALACRPFSLVVEGLGCFPDAANPRIIWAGVRSEPLLSDLQKRMEKGL